MTYTEVLELIRAGFKKDEIEAMMAAEKKPSEKAPEPEQKTEPKQDPKPEPDKAPEPEAKPEPSETEKLVAALGLKFDALTQAIQKQNVEGLEGKDSTQTVDDVIAKIINPHYGEV